MVDTTALHELLDTQYTKYKYASISAAQSMVISNTCQLYAKFDVYELPSQAKQGA